MFSLLAVLIVQLRRAFADRRDLLVENAALRPQLAVYQRNGARPKLTSADRLFWVWFSLFDAPVLQFQNAFADGSLSSFQIQIEFRGPTGFSALLFP
jgi:hypothetical protein